MKTACKKMITQQVSEILRIEIEDGDLYPGTKIPTDTELAEMFGVQKQIVRTAIEVLVKEGLLKYISDKEVYVLGHKIERNMEKLEGFTQLLRVSLNAEETVTVFPALFFYPKAGGRRLKH